MNRAHLLLALAAFCSPTAAASETSNAPPRGVLLLVADDLGWGELSSRGHPHIVTPHLDAMAEDGLQLERFYAAAPVCSPTRASILTGRHPVRTSTFAWGHDLPEDETTLPELLAQNNVRTAHFGKWHLGSVRAGHPTSPGAQGYDRWAAHPNFFDLNPDLSVEGEVISHDGEGSDVITDRALAFLERAAEDDVPFFVTVWFGSPHDPHVANEEDLTAFSAAPDGARAYCAEIAALDRSVGRLRAALETHGLGERTLVWMTSDNGPRPPKPLDRSDSTGGLRGAKGTLWDGGLRVPSILVWPQAIDAGRSSAALSGTVDLLPTIAEAFEVAVPGTLRLDGTSLLSHLREPSKPAPARALGFWAPPINGRAQWGDRILGAMARGETHPSETPPTVDPAQLGADRFPGHAAWIQGSEKLHAIPTESGVRHALFDLGDDPAESKDLASERPERVAVLRAELEAWQRRARTDALTHLQAAEASR